VNQPGPTVYIVDDDASVREALASLIRAVGLQAASFPTASEFLRQPRPEGAACLVLDLHLPDVTGLDLQHELEASGRPIPTVFITGRYEALTLREREVMTRVVEGRLNKQIAGDLGVTEITVKVHRRHIMDKMHVARWPSSCAWRSVYGRIRRCNGCRGSSPVVWKLP
jgi:FixJ family two-component response regulator